MSAIEQTDQEVIPPTFDTLNLTDEVKRALEEIGYLRPTPVQLATYNLAVAGQDIIVQARTGTGKTAAFAIPLVDKMLRDESVVQALVLAPTRELALQSAKEIARIGKHRHVRVAAVYGGAPMGKQIDELAEGAQIVSGTPGRVLDHLRRGTLNGSQLRVLVLDEMDEMLSMGFARELNAILEFLPDKSRRQTMCFSATVDGDVRRHAERHMKDPQMVSLSSDAVGATAISHHVYMVSGSDRVGDLVKILEVEDPESAIVFCNLRAETEQVAGALQQAGFNADWLNGDLPQRDRENIMGATREGKLRYLVATDVAARGIDISHLTHVINYSFPETAAQYVHRTGRTGRAGRTGCAISLVSPLELGRLYYLRLEYKISPIERSLPNKGELLTRKEGDRVAMLSEAFAAGPRAEDLALAHRLLTHPDAERIVGGLVRTFFGGSAEEVDDQAAAARRARGPTKLDAPEPAPVRRPARDAGQRTDRQQAQSEREPRRESSSTPREPRAPAPREQGRDAPRERSPRPAPVARAAQSDQDNRAFAPGDGQPAALLLLDVGRQDGVRVGEIAHLMRDVGGLERADVGRIRVREHHTFVEVPNEKLDHALEKLRGHTVYQKALSPERAKVSQG